MKNYQVLITILKVDIKLFDFNHQKAKNPPAIRWILNGRDDTNIVGEE